MINKTELLIPDATYHVYNRANGNEILFMTDENYRFFLAKYNQYISPIAHTYCYCLMPNHFHFLIQIKSEAELNVFFNSKEKFSKTLQGFKTLEGFAKQEPLSKLLSMQFSHLFNSYCQAFNKQNNRKGSLLMHPYKRKRVTDIKYLLKLVHYIHYNPIEAKLCETPTKWPFSSYTSLISKTDTTLKRQEVINWFNDIDNFIYVHTKAPVENDIF